MICPKCGAELSEDSEFCNECGEKIVTFTEILGKPYSSSDNNTTKYVNSKKITLDSSNRSKITTVLTILIGIILICLSLYFFNCGFDKKDNYVSSLTNSYVGGDAYNYIINGTYFSGYMALGSGILVSGVGLLCTGLILGKRRNK